MGQTLTHGVYLPDEGERNCYNGLAGNWSILDNSVGTVAEHSTQIAGKAPLVHTHVKADITDFPALANVATSGSYNDLSNIPASFTPASHTHGNITNDGEVGTTANKPLITGTGGVVQAGSFGNSANTFCEGNDSRLSDARTPVAHTHTKSDVTDLLNSNFIPSANNSYDLGSSSYQWNNLYAKNYYYNGVAWGLDKANVWTNFNRINGYRLEVKSSSQEIGVIPSSNQWNGFQFTDKNNTRTVSFEHGFLGSGETRFGISMVDNFASNDSGSTVWKEFLRLSTYSGGSSFTVGADLRPLSNNLNLGLSTNKWKTLNGINPGALSLPDYNNYLDVTSNIPVASLDGTQIDLNTYLADKTGWLSIVIADTAGNCITVTQGRAGGSTVFNNSRTFHTGAQSNGCISVFFPIIASMSKFAFIKASSLIQMRFYYCLGNV